MKHFSCVDEVSIVEEISYLMAVQISFCRSIERSKEDVARFESSISKLDDDIDALKERLWWIRFLQFCNTSCWRFKL